MIAEDRVIKKIDELSHWIRWQRLLRGWSAKQLANEAVKSAQKMGHELHLRQQSISFLEGRKIKSIPSWIEYVEQAFEDNKVDSKLAEKFESPLNLKSEKISEFQTKICPNKLKLPDEISLKKLLLALLAPVEDNIPWESKRNIADVLAQRLPKGLEQISLFQ
nr:hypothetical protein [Zymomonas mobilis]